MAEITQRIYQKIVPPGEWVYIFLTFDHTEATTAELIAEATETAVNRDAPEPASLIVSAICAENARRIIENNGPDGVFMKIECPVGTTRPSAANIIRIGHRKK